MQNFHVGFAVKNYIEHCIDELIEQQSDTLNLSNIDERSSYFDHEVFFPDKIKKCSKNLRKLVIRNHGTIENLSNIESLTNIEEIYIGNIGICALEKILELPKLKRLTFKISQSLSSRPDLLAKISKINEISSTELVYKEIFDLNLKFKNIIDFTISDEISLNTLSNLLEADANFYKIDIYIYTELWVLIKNFDWSKLINVNAISIRSDIEGSHHFFIEKISESKLNCLEHLDLSTSGLYLEHEVKTLDIKKIKELDTLTSLSIDLGNYNLENTEILRSVNKLEELALDFNISQETLNHIEQLGELRKLDLRLNNEIHNINFLNKLRHIELLSLTTWSEKLKDSIDLSVFKVLKNLKHLTLQEGISLPLEDIEDLTNLKTLSIDHFYLRENHKPISFPNVRNLHLRNLEDEYLLTAFPNLTSINVSGLSKKGLKFIENNSSLKVLVLRQCHDIDDFSSIPSFSSLETLNIFHSANLENLEGIERLTKLSLITITNCPNLKSIESIVTLEKLNRVRIINANSLRISWAVSKKLFFEKTITKNTYINYCEHIPTELTIMGQTQKLESWYEEILTQGYESPSAVKVMLLGNGRIGKTQLARRLRGEEYDETISSTHGIEVFDFQAEHNSNIDIQCWDFGGQDVYLGTHSLFIDNRALYLLLWTPESENTDIVECEEIKIRNRPLSYWLAYLKSLAGKNANVLICQSQCDDASKDQTAPIPQPTPISKVRPLTLSAKLDNGLDIFNPHFKRAVDFQLTQNGDVWIPKSWLRIVEKIDQLRKQSIDTLPYSEYLNLSEECHVHAPETLVSYLHQSGKVFYREGCFNNQLILNQQWALQGVYLLLHREDAIPNLVSMEGKFNQATIERLLWKSIENCEDKHLFIEMMMQCGACFQIESDCYIAPDALPEFEVIQQRIEQTWQGAEANYHVRLNYDFLHDATMRYLLSKIGENAKAEACYWKYGCCYYDSKHKAKVFFKCYLLTEEQKQNSKDFINYGQPGYIDIQIKAASSMLIVHLIDSILEINHLDAKATVEWIKGEPKEEKEKEKQVEQGPKEPFSHVGKGGLDPDRKPNVYFSYAWGKNENDPKQKVCDEIFNKLKSDKSIQVFRDKDSMNSGDSIEAFEKEIGKADFVFMIISEKSLYQSSHCMNELRLVYERAQSEKQAFVSKVIPVIMDDAKIDNSIDRLKVVKNWTQKRDELDNIISEVGAEAAGAESTSQLQIMRSFINSTANALSWMADLVIDRTPELQADTAISLLKTRIEQSKQ